MAGQSGDGGASGSSDAGGVGGASGVGGEAGSGVSKDTSLCEAFAQKYCQRDSECAPFQFQSTYLDSDDCQQSTQRDCVEAIQAPGSNTSAAHVLACVEAADCGFWLGTEQRSGACAFVPGELPDGSGCYTLLQCQSTMCSIEESGGCGHCVSLSQLGEPCEFGLVKPCAPDLVCDASQHVCVPFATEGQPCENVYCRLDLECGYNPDDNVPTCMKPGTKQLGEACETAAECDRHQGLYCGPEGTCTYQPLAALGEVCGNEQVQNIICAGDGRCAVSGDKRVCVPRASEGAPCSDQSDDPGCALFLRCQNGVCTSAAPTCP